ARRSTRYPLSSTSASTKPRLQEAVKRFTTSTLVPALTSSTCTSTAPPPERAANFGRRACESLRNGSSSRLRLTPAFERRPEQPLACRLRDYRAHGRGRGACPRGANFARHRGAPRSFGVVGRCRRAAGREAPARRR